MSISTHQRTVTQSNFQICQIIFLKTQEMFRFLAPPSSVISYGTFRSSDDRRRGVLSTNASASLPPETMYAEGSAAGGARADTSRRYTNGHVQGMIDMIQSVLV